jgi:hypothetical protein
VAPIPRVTAAIADAIRSLARMVSAMAATTMPQRL